LLNGTARGYMLTRIMKLAAVVALAWLLIALWRSSANYSTIWAASVIFAAAIVAFSQAVGARSYGWAVMFIGVVALFATPAIPRIRNSTDASRGVIVNCIKLIGAGAS